MDSESKTFKPLTPQEYWNITNSGIDNGLSTEEFWAINGREAVEKIISDFDANQNSPCCFDAGIYANGSRVLIDICAYHLKELVDAHKRVEKIGSLTDAKNYVPDQYKSQELKAAILVVKKCAEISSALQKWNKS